MNGRQNDAISQTPRASPALGRNDNDNNRLCAITVIEKNGKKK